MCVYSTVIVCFRPSVVSGPPVHSFGSQYVLKLVYYESIIWTLSFDSIIRDSCCFFKIIEVVCAVGLCFLRLAAQLKHYG